MPGPRVLLRWRRDGETANAGSVAIVVDVLRASTSITTALARGAEAVVAVTEVEEARRLARAHDCLLVGERQNRRIEGFDFGNAPAAINALDLTGTTIAFTSTNFPHALAAAGAAKHVLIGAVVNVAAVTTAAIELAERDESDICIVLAGEPIEAHAFEDHYFAGCAARLLSERGSLDEEAARAAEIAGVLSPDEAAARSKHAQELLSVGDEADVVFALTRDRFDIVGVLRDGWIRRRE
jgi:2-phosphosulfolactate phosphatase